MAPVVRSPGRVSITRRTVSTLSVLVALSACARFAASTNSAGAQPSVSPTAMAAASQSPPMVISANAVNHIADPEGIALAYIVAQTHTEASDWELLKKAVADIGPYPDAAWSGKFYNGATKDDACVIVLAEDQVIDCDATLDLQAQAEAQLAVVAQQLFDDNLASRPGVVAAAAFVTTIYGIYAESLIDTAGIRGTPGPHDRVIVLEAEGLFPATHSCPFSSPCTDTGYELTYDVATSEIINFHYFYDPWSRDLPSPQPSVSERFNDLRQFGTPVSLAIDHQP